MKLYSELKNKDQILRNNISTVSKEALVLQEEKQIFLREFFELQLADDPVFEVAVERLHSAHKELLQDRKSVLPTANDEKVMIAKMLSEKYEIPLTIPGENNVLLFSRNASVACLPTNGFSSPMLEKLLGIFPEWKAIHVENYTEICELIGQDKADFGILPIENSTNGRLTGFYSMIDKHDLKICAVCDMEDDEHETVTRFALVSHALYCPINDETVYLELSAVSTNAVTALELIAIAEQFNIFVKRLSSLPLYYQRNSCIDTITLALSRECVKPFLLYLYLFNKDINILGFYFQI